MAQSNSLGHDATRQAVFSSTEVDGFQADDRRAAAAIVGLMVGIFTLGLIGYLGVCYWVTH
jgi:hypothetical protein